MKEITSIEEIEAVSGGSNWGDIGYQFGRGIGWFYHNILIGTPWP